MTGRSCLSPPLILLTAACTGQPPAPPVATSTDSRAVKAGDTVTTTFSLDDRPLSETTLQVAKVEDASLVLNNHSALILLPVSERFPDAATAAAHQGTSPLHPVTADRLQQFLSEHWDAYKGGTADAGVDTESFLDYVGQEALDIETFLELFDTFSAAGLPLADVIALLDASRDGQAVGPVDLADFLAATGLDGRGFLQALGGAGLTPATFFARLQAGGLSLPQLTSDLQQTGKTFPAWLAAPGFGTASQDRQRDGFRLTPWSWQFLDTDRPILATASLLSATDAEPSHYLGDTKGATGLYHFRMRGRGQDGSEWPMSDISWRYDLRYGARHATQPGAFIPRIAMSDVISHPEYRKRWAVSALANGTFGATVSGAGQPDPVVAVEVRVASAGVCACLGSGYLARLRGLHLSGSRGPLAAGP